MQCHKCFNVNAAHQAFCGACGNELLPQSTALHPHVVHASNQRSSGDFTWPKAALAAFVLGGGGLTTYLILPLAAALVAIALIGFVGALYAKNWGSSWLRTYAILLSVGGAVGLAGNLIETTTHARAQERARIERAAELAKIPKLFDDVRSGVAAARWKEAVSAYHEIVRIDSTAASQLSSELIKIHAGLQELEQAELYAARRAELATALSEAGKLLEDKTTCNTPDALSNVWDVLKQTTADEAEYPQARSLLPRLEKCRKQVKAEMDKALQATLRVRRADVRAALDRRFLDQGFDVEIATYKDQITLTNALFGNRAMVHSLTKDGTLLDSFRTGGFRKATFSDGFGTSIYFDNLEPSSQLTEGARKLVRLGLDAPLTL